MEFRSLIIVLEHYLHNHIKFNEKVLVGMSRRYVTLNKIDQDSLDNLENKDESWEFEEEDEWGLTEDITKFDV